MVQSTAAAITDVLPDFRFNLIPTHKPDQLLEQMRSALARNLPLVEQCVPHVHILSVAGGGPSLEDTYKDLTGAVAAINGSLAYLLNKDVVPDYCGVCDPSPHMVDIVEADKRVTYFLASIVHPSVFDKLINAGCDVVLWHLGPVAGSVDLLNELCKDKWLQLGGGSTMGLRWINLGYACGFRKFHLHGLDSSFRGASSHAYPDHQDAKQWIRIEGYLTRPNFIAQVKDFLDVVDRFTERDIEAVEFKVFGDGLLQTKWREWESVHPNAFSPEKKAEKSEPINGFVWPTKDRWAAPAILEDAKNINKLLEHVPGRGTVVQAGGNVGVYPSQLSRHFQTVRTFEPDAENFRCLRMNLAGNDHVVLEHAALGDRLGTCGLREGQANNVGAYRVIEEGTIAMVPIDALQLPECDLIWLDVEGYEQNVLQGGVRTIEQFRPAVIIEENGAAVEHGLPADGARQWLLDHGYERHAQMGRDNLYLSATQRVPDTEDSERAKYVQMWADVPQYRAFSPGEELVDIAIEQTGMAPPESLIDFGCGPGRATKKFADAGYMVTAVDIAPNCLDPGIDVPLIVANLWGLPTLMAHWGYCCDVMEHIPPERVDAVLSGIRRSTGRGAFFQIALSDETFGAFIGQRLHLTVRSVDWWMTELQKHWDHVRVLWPDPGHLRAIFVVT